MAAAADAAAELLRNSLLESDIFSPIGWKRAYDEMEKHI
jgi:hypothetical protein